MQYIARTLLLSLVLFVGSPSWAAEPIVETEVVETTLESARVVEKEKLHIQLKNGVSFELDSRPNVEEMKEALGLKIPEEIKNEILDRGGSIEEVDPLAPYESLSAQEKVDFARQRRETLTSLARVLTASRFALGAGSLVGDSLSFVKIKVKHAIGKGKGEDVPDKVAFAERSQRVVQNILRSVDYKLWSQAPLLLASNEYGLSLSVGLQAETGVMHKGGGGADELGLALAYNKEKRAFVFEIFHNSENFDNTKAAVTVLGVVGKAGVVMSRRSGAEKLKGSSFYPPVVPGFSTVSPDFFAGGMSSSLGFPPPPLADLMTYTNRFERNTLIRITVSPIVKGFVRLQIGDLKGSMRLVVMRFVDVYRVISDKVFRTGKRSCGLVFN